MVTIKRNRNRSPKNKRYNPEFKIQATWTMDQIMVIKRALKFFEDISPAAQDCLCELNNALSVAKIYVSNGV